MAKILFHLTNGPEHPTRAALGFYMARLAAEEGHEVSMFLAGDAVTLVRPATAAAVHGIGTGSLSEHQDALRGTGARIYMSAKSSEARAITQEDASVLGAELVHPRKLIELAVENDRMFTY
jgi:predicted peroxiredoxin